MKQIISLLLAVALLCGLAACGSPGSTAAAASPAVSAPASAPASGPEQTAASLAGVVLTPPDGFALVEDEGFADYDAVYAAEDGSSIMVYHMDGAPGFDRIDREMMETEIAAQYAGFDSVEVLYYSEEEILGCPARRMDISLVYQEMPLRQILVMIKGDSILNLAFSDLSDNGGYGEAFEACLSGMQPA